MLSHVCQEIARVAWLSYARLMTSICKLASVAVAVASRRRSRRSLSSHPTHQAQCPHSLLQRHACRVANSFSHRLIGIICLTRTTNWTTGEATERQTELTERKTDGPNRPTGLTRRRNVTNDENNLFCMQTPFVMCCCNFSSCCCFCYCCCFILWLLLPCLAYAERCCRA